MARIALAGFLHETNTFAPSRATYEVFVEPDAWPGLLLGREVLSGMAGMNIAAAGFIAEAQARGHRLEPLLWASANPSGCVTQDAYERICGMLIQRLREAGPVDALFLDLHGAMVAEHVEDGEGELLERIRAVTGPGLPIVAVLDFHANVSPRMVRLADALVVYRTYPHVDMADSGRRAARLLERLLTGERLHKAFHQLPFLIPMPLQCTLTEPFATFMRLSRELERGGVDSTAVVPGFPLADVFDAGPSVLAYGTDAAAVAAAAAHLRDTVLAQRANIGGKFLSVDEAVALARGWSGRTLVLADTQDNPGGGGAGDTTDILHALQRSGVTGVCAGIVCDPLTAAAAHRAGVGARLKLALGGRSGAGAPPLEGVGIVAALGDGRFTGTGPFYQGCRMDLGPMARLSLPGMEVLVSSRKQQAADQAMFRHLGVEPAGCRVLVLKSSVHFRADFGALAGRMEVVIAPGENVANPAELHFRRLRPGVSTV